MRTLERRVAAMEAPAASYSFEHMSDEQLQARVDEITSLLGENGIVFPDGFDAMPYSKQQAVLHSIMQEVAA